MLCLAAVRAARGSEPAAGGEGGAGERAGYTHPPNPQTGGTHCSDWLMYESMI